MCNASPGWPVHSVASFSSECLRICLCLQAVAPAYRSVAIRTVEAGDGGNYLADVTAADDDVKKATSSLMLGLLLREQRYVTSKAEQERGGDGFQHVSYIRDLTNDKDNTGAGKEEA